MLFKDVDHLLSYIITNELPKLDSCQVGSLGPYAKYLFEFSQPEPFTHVDYKLLRNNITLSLLRLIQKLSHNLTLQKKAYIVLAIHTYMSLFKKFIPYCYEDRMQVALDKLRPNHAFKKFGSISKFVAYTALRVMKRYPTELDDHTVVKMYLELRTALAQSLRRFSKVYHTLKPEDMQPKKTFGQIVIDAVKLKILTEPSSKCPEPPVNLDQRQVESLLTLLLKDIESKRTVCSVLVMKKFMTRYREDSEYRRRIQATVGTKDFSLITDVVSWLLCRVRELINC